MSFDCLYSYYAFSFADAILRQNETSVKRLYLIIFTILITTGYIAEICLLFTIYVFLSQCSTGPNPPEDTKSGHKQAIFRARLIWCAILVALYVAMLALRIRDTVRLDYDFEGVPVATKILVAYRTLLMVASIDVLVATILLNVNASKGNLSQAVSLPYLVSGSSTYHSIASTWSCWSNWLSVPILRHHRSCICSALQLSAVFAVRLGRSRRRIRGRYHICIGLYRFGVCLPAIRKSGLGTLARTSSDWSRANAAARGPSDVSTSLTTLWAAVRASLTSVWSTFAAVWIPTSTIRSSSTTVWCTSAIRAPVKTTQPGRATGT